MTTLSSSSSLSSSTATAVQSTDQKPPPPQQQQQQQQQQPQRQVAASTVFVGPIPPSYPQWHNLIAGGVAGAGARLATAPLDLIRIRAQLERNVTYPRPSMWSSLVNIYQGEGGIVALFRGSVAATYLWIGYSMVQFTFYARIKDGLLEQQRHHQQEQQQQQGQEGEGAVAFGTIWSTQPFFTNQTSIAFFAGAGAGVCATIATYPFDICRTIFAAKGVMIVPTLSAAATTTSTAIATTTSTILSSSSGLATTTTVASTAITSTNFKPPTSLIECATSMYTQKNGGGFKAFFAGVNPAIVQIIPYMGFNFAIYDYLTQGEKGIGLSGYAGSISGAVSKMIVYPMDTVKKRIQVQSVFGTVASTTTSPPTTTIPTTGTVTTRRYTGAIDCFVTMIRQEGIMSLYRGLLPSVLKTTIGSGLSFAFFRMTKNLLEDVHDQYHHHHHQHQ
jgi:solute carrier family 25 thiamine pyrophosphate transporter 19